MIRTAILTVNDNGSKQELADEAVQAVRSLLTDGPFVEVDYQLVPAEQAIIRAKLRIWADGDQVDLILTTGGIGLALRDRTPDATVEVIDRHIPGLAEVMRSASVAHSPALMLSRGVAGVRRNTLILNLPSAADAAKAALTAVIQVLPLALEQITGQKTTIS